jgi:ABC-type sugar transport system ATPase subunit
MPGSSLDAGPVLRATGLSKVYPPANSALRGVDLHVMAGEIRGLLGANGAGKSTLIKLLCGVEKPTSGTIWLQGIGEAHFAEPRDAHAAGIGVVHQELPLLPNLTAAENVILGVQGGGFLGPRRKRRIEREYQEIAAQFPGAPAANVALEQVGLQGWQLTAIIRARHAGARILILDEPTSSLDPRERRILHDNLRRIAAQGTAVLYVSHFLDDVLDVCGSVTVLRDGAVVLSSPTAGLGESDLLAAMIGGDVSEIAARDDGGRRHGAGEGLRLSGLACGAVGPIDLALPLGERLGVYGLEGSGAAELLRAIFGLARHDGQLSWQGRALSGDSRSRIDAGLALVSGDRVRTMIGEWTVAMNYGLPGLGARYLFAPIDTAAESRAARASIGKLAIKGEAEQPLRTLSGGNQQKVALGRWLDRSGICLLADEPTRGVDVRGRAAIHQTLMDFCAAGNSLLIRSTDPEELAELCHRVVIMAEGRIIREIAGAEITSEELESATRTKMRSQAEGQVRR